MDEVQVDVEQLGLPARRAHDVARPRPCRRVCDPWFDASAALPLQAPDCAVLRRFQPTLDAWQSTETRRRPAPARRPPARRPARARARRAGGRVAARRTSSGCGRSRARRAPARRTRSSSRRSRRCRSSGRRACCAPSGCTSSSRTSPSSTTACAGCRAYKLEERVPAESLDDSFAQLEGVPAEELERRVSLELVLTAHPTEATRRTVLASHLRIAALLAELDDPLLAPARRARSSRRSRRRSPRTGRRTRCARGGRASSTRSATGTGSSSRASSTRPSGCSPTTGGICPDAPAPLRWGTWIGGDADGNPNAGADTIREALERARAAAPPPLPRRGARARGRDRRLVAPRRRSTTELLASIERDERELPEYADGDRRPEPRRAVPAQALLHVAAARRRRVRIRRRRSPRISRVIDRSLRAQPRRAHRRRRARRATPPRRALRAAPREARRAHARARPRRSRRAHPRRSLDAVADARARHGPQALDTWIVSGTDSADDVRRVHELTDEPLSVVPLFESVEALRAAPRIYEELLDTVGCREVMVGYSDSAKDAGYLARAVGDPPRARRARGRRARARRRADRLPRPRRQRGPRRRADVRRDPRAAAGRAARTAEGDRAGRDDRVQVRPAGARVPQPRGGARGDAARRGAGAHGRRPARGRRGARRRARRQLARGVPRARRRRRASSTSSARSRRSTSSRC